MKNTTETFDQFSFLNINIIHTNISIFSLDTVIIEFVSNSSIQLVLHCILFDFTLYSLLMDLHMPVVDLQNNPPEM